MKLLSDKSINKTNLNVLVQEILNDQQKVNNAEINIYSCIDEINEIMKLLED